jgi:hypothetical protein
MPDGVPGFFMFVCSMSHIQEMPFGGVRRPSHNVSHVNALQPKGNAMPTPHGYQPLREVLKEQGIPQPKAAKDLGVSWRHFRNVIIGRTRPVDVLREKLPVYLGVELRDLFTRSILAKPYEAHTSNEPVR